MNLNPIDFNYIDGENIYPLQEYIDDKLTEVSITGLYSSNVFLNNNLKINDAFFFSNSSNLYIKNNIAFGEIRFSTFVNYPDNSNFNYGTKIDFAGRLQIYHNYNLFFWWFARAGGFLLHYFFNIFISKCINSSLISNS